MCVVCGVDKLYTSRGEDQQQRNITQSPLFCFVVENDETYTSF